MTGPVTSDSVPITSAKGSSRDTRYGMEASSHPAAAATAEAKSTQGPASEVIISVVVPVHNLAASIERFIDAVIPVLRDVCRNFELLLIDDGSTDASVDIIQAKLPSLTNVRLIVLSRHYGEQIAFTAGLEHAIGDYVVLMRGTFHDAPELIPKLIARARDGADVVCVAGGSSGEPFVRRLVAKCFFRLTRKLTGFDLREDLTPYRVLSRRVVNSITRLKEHNRYMPMLFEYVGYRLSVIPYQSTTLGEVVGHGYSYREKVRLAIDAIVAFSDRPLRYAAIVSVLVSMTCLLGTVAVVIERSLSDNLAEGWASIMVLQLLMFSMLFLFLAIFSEYIARILVEAKQRPLYYVREEHGGTRFDIGGIVKAD